MSVFVYEKYDLGVPDENKVFDKYRLGVLIALRLSYGDKYYGDAFTNTRFDRERYTVFVCRRDAKVIATTFVSPSGKNSGLGVLKQYRHLRVAREVMLFSQRVFRYQYAEIAVNSAQVRRFLTLLGWKPIGTVSRLRELYGSEFRHVKEIAMCDGYAIVEMRSIKHVENPDAQRVIMYEYAAEM